MGTVGPAHSLFTSGRMGTTLGARTARLALRTLRGTSSSPTLTWSQGHAVPLGQEVSGSALFLRTKRGQLDKSFQCKQRQGTHTHMYTHMHTFPTQAEMPGLQDLDQAVLGRASLRPLCRPEEGNWHQTGWQAWLRGTWPLAICQQSQAALWTQSMGTSSCRSPQKPGPGPRRDCEPCYRLQPSHFAAVGLRPWKKDVPEVTGPVSTVRPLCLPPRPLFPPSKIRNPGSCGFARLGGQKRPTRCWGRGWVDVRPLPVCHPLMQLPCFWPLDP